MKRYVIMAGAMAAVFASADVAKAAPLIADGVTYSLIRDAILGSPLTEQFTLNITGINGAADTEKQRTGVNAIAFNQPSNFFSAVMLIPPSGYNFVAGGLNSSGCDGNGNFFCFDNTAIPPTPTTPFAANSSLSYTFDVIVSAPTNFANYTPDFKIDWVGNKHGGYDLVSKTITSTDGGTINPQVGDVPTPEPATLAVLGVGLAGMIAVRRRRNSVSGMNGMQQASA